MKKEADRSGWFYLKKQLFLVSLLFLIILTFAISVALIQLRITGLAFGIPEENNFTQEIAEENFSEISIEQSLNDIPEEVQQENMQEQINEQELNKGEYAITTTQDSNFKIASSHLPLLPFIPSIPNNKEVKYMGYKHTNRSNIIISVKDYISCAIDSDANDDGWKRCTVIFEVQNDNAIKPNLRLPSIALNFTNYDNARNNVITFSNISSLINETFTDFVLVDNPEFNENSDTLVERQILIENSSMFQKRNFTNFTSLPSRLVTGTPFAIKVDYEARKFTGNIFNLSIRAAGFSAFIDPDQSACGTLSTDGGQFSLTQNVRSTGTCFTMGANNLVLNCNNYTINYSTSGTTASFGIDNTGSYDNITIKGCNIFEGNSSAFNQGRFAFNFIGSENSSIIFNNITTEGNRSHGIVLNSSSNYNNISFNIINITTLRADVNAHAIDIENSDSNRIDNNLIFTNGSEGNAVRLNVAHSNTISNNHMNVTGGTDISGSLLGGRPIRCADSNLNTIYRNTINSLYGGSSMAIWLLRCSDNNVSYNYLRTTGNASSGVLFDGSTSGSPGSIGDNNTLMFNVIVTTNFNSFGYWVRNNNNNTIISDNITALSSSDISVQQGNATFINVTFDRNDIFFNPATSVPYSINGTITIKWYTTINLSNYARQGLKDGNVTAYNVSFALDGNSNTTTNENGTIVQTFTLIEYTRNVSNTFYHTPHRINASRTNYDDNFTTINLTALSSPVDFLRIIYMPEFNAPSVSISSSAGTSFYQGTTTTLTCTGTDVNGMRSVSMTADGSSVCSGGGSCSRSISPGEGTVSVSCTASDIFSNTGSGSITLSVAKQSGGGSGSGVGAGGGTTGSTAPSTTTGETTTSAQSADTTSQTTAQPSTEPTTESQVSQATEAPISSGSIIGLSPSLVVGSIMPIDTIQEVILGIQAEETIAQETGEEITAETGVAEMDLVTTGEQAVSIAQAITETSVDVEGKVVAVVKTGKGSRIIVKKGTGKDEKAIGVSFRTPKDERINLKYKVRCEGDECINKPSLDLSFVKLRDIGFGLKDVKYSIMPPMIVIIIILLALDYGVWFVFGKRGI